MNNGDELSPKIYNYQTTSGNPKNLNIMCNTQGVAVGSGNGRICLHCPNASGGLDDTYIQVDATDMAAGAAQEESDADRAVIAAAGGATVSTFGPPEMGKCCNAVMTMQLPIQQKKERMVSKGIYSTVVSCEMMAADCQPPVYRSMSGSMSVGRASIGSSAGTHVAHKFEEIKLDESQVPTITVCYYVVCEGGIPSEDKIKRVIEHLDTLYDTVGTAQFDLDDAPKGVTAPLTTEVVDECMAAAAAHPLKKPTGVPSTFSFDD